MNNFSMEKELTDLFANATSITFADKAVALSASLTDEQRTELVAGITERFKAASGDGVARTKAKRVMAYVFGYNHQSALTDEFAPLWAKPEGDAVHIPRKGTVATAVVDVLWKLSQGADLEAAKAEVLADKSERGESERNEYMDKQIIAHRTKMLAWMGKRHGSEMVAQFNEAMAMLQN